MTTYTPRPHENYIEWIDEHLENLAIILADPRPEELSVWDYFNASLLANRAGLERHKPEKEAWGERIVCEWCENLCHSGSGLYCDSPDAPFPCPPHTDITKHLDLVMGER